MNKPIGKFENEELFLTVGSYGNNNRLFLGLDTKEESYADITINLPDMMIPSQKCVFLSGDISEELKNFLKEKKIIEDSFGVYQYNYGRYEMVKIDYDRIKELDPNGFKEYKKNLVMDMER